MRYAAAGLVLFALTLAGHLFNGRIQPVPSMDDATYFREAMRWLYAFHEGGLPGLAKWILVSPPHSLYSAALATASYALFGVNHWAPYVGNGLTLALLVWAIAIALRGLEGRWTVLLAGALLAIPAASMTVSEFRPDFACGLLVAHAVLRLTDPASPRDWTLAGLFAGLAVLAKPSFAPYVAVVFLAAWAVAWAAHRTGLRALIAFALAGLADFALKGSREIHYILDNVYGRYHDIWTRPLEGAGHATYHLTGEGGQFLFGSAFWPLALIAFAPLALPPLVKLHWRRLGVLFAATAAAWAVAAAVEIKSPYSGSVLAMLLIVQAAAVLAIFCKPFDRPRPGWIAGALLFLLFAAFYRPAPNGRRAAALIRTEGPAIAALIDRVAAVIAARPPDAWNRVWITTYGHLANQESLELLLLQRGLTRVEFLDLHRTTDPADQRKALADADIVVAGPAAGPDLLPWLPSNKGAAQTLALLRADGRHAEFGDPAGGYRVFRRRGAWVNTAPVSGFDQVEGPYPQFNLGQVFWALGNEASAQAAPAYSGVRQWRFRARAPMPGQVMTVYQRDAKVAEFAFPAAQADIDGAFPAAGDAPVTFRFSQAAAPTKTETRRLAVLFSTVEATGQ